MTRFGVHLSMRHLREDAEVEALLRGGGSDPCLRDVMQGLRAMATTPPPTPAGELELLLTDGFVPQQPRAPKRRLERARRWTLRTAVLAAPLGLKIAGASIAAAATFGGLAASDALPQPVERWVDSVIERVSADGEPGEAAAAVALPTPGSVEIASRDAASSGPQASSSLTRPRPAEPKRKRTHDADERADEADQPGGKKVADAETDSRDESGTTGSAPEASQPSRQRPVGEDEGSEDLDRRGTDDQQQDAEPHDDSRAGDNEAADDARDVEEEAAGDARDAHEEAVGDARDAEEEAADDAQDAEEEAADAESAWLGVVTSFNTSTNQLVVTRSNGTAITGKLRRGAELSWDNDDCHGTSDAEPSDLKPGTGVYDIEFEEGYIDAVALHCSDVNST